MNISTRVQPEDMDLSAMGVGGPHQLPFNPPPTVESSLPQTQTQAQPTGAGLNSTNQASPPSKRRRTSSASLSNCCRTCRLRKVKCSGNPNDGGPCTNCARLELACPFTVSSDEVPKSGKISRVKPSQSHTEAGTVRKRAQRACRQCHAQKTKCSGELPRCKRCENADLKCEYTPAKRKFNFEPNAAPAEDAQAPPPPQPAPVPPSATATATPETAHSSASNPEPSKSPDPKEAMARQEANFPLVIDTSVLTAQELLTRKNFIIKHLDAYFENIYWLPCMGFFHPETAYREVYEGTFDPPTATALCAITTFFVNPNNEAAQEFGRKCCDEIEFFIFRNIHKFSDRTLLPYALILSFNFLSGSFAKVWQCFGLASRLMTGLQLNWDVSTRNKSFQQQELKRRIAWQFFVMDRLLAGGYEEYISCRRENMKIRLPCHEDAFWEDTPVVAERLMDKNAKCKGIGLHGLNLRIVDLNHRIQDWTKKLVSRSILEPSKVMEDVNNFQNELTRFHLSIPDDIRLSDQSIAKYIAAPERAGYVFLHTHLSVGHIDLYRFALPGILDPNKNDILQRLPQGFVERSKKQAVAHALCTGRFCVAIQNEAEKQPHSGKTPLAGDATIPQMATQSLRVFLIAMQHKIYDNLTQDTTAPLWRFQDPNESYIRSLIEDGLFRVSAPWSPILMTCNQAHTNNQAMLAEFNKTQKFADQKGTVGFSGSKTTNGVTRLPGPHYILENANYGVIEQERRTRAADAATANRWFRSANQHQQQPDQSPYTPPEADFDSEYGPPGVPLLLAVARNSVGMDQPERQPGETPVPTQNMYELEKNGALLMQEKMWLSGGMATPDPHQQFLGAAGAPGHGGPGPLPMLQMDPTDPTNMMFPPPPPPPPPQQQQGGQVEQGQVGVGGMGSGHVDPGQGNGAPQQYLQEQPGMYMDGYGGQYPTGTGAEQAAYMQQQF